MKKLLTLLLISLFSLTYVSAIGNTLPIQIQTTDSLGNIVTGTFEFTINISNSSTCSPVLYSNISTKTTDNRGIVSYDITVDLDFSEQYYLCFYRDGVSKINKTIGTNPYSFRANVSDYHNPLNNLTAPFFFGDGSLLTGLAGGGDINGVTTNGAYLSGGVDSGIANLLFNETKLNQTIDSRGGGDTWWGLNENYIYNNSNNLDFNETKLNATIDLRDSDTTYSNGTGISLVGTTFSVVLSYFQGLFIELTDEGNLNVNSSDNWDNLDTPMDITEMNNFTANKINATCCVYLGTIQSTDGNSIKVQPTGDEDDFFSFKTPAHRPTIKREGGKFIYIESSNVYDVGISARADDTYSGTINYEKDTHKMTLLGKNSPVAIKTNSEYKNYFLFETYDHQPQLSVFNGTKLLINDSLEVNGIVNATGKVYSEGIEVLTSYSDTNASTACSGTTTYLDGEGNCDDISSVYRADSWNNFTGIPHTTPSNGDTTHFSLADEIYDFVIGLAYATTTYVDNLIGTYTHLTNFTDDLGDRGYTDLSNFTNDLGFYNSTNPSPDTQDLSYDSGTDVISLVDGGSIDITEVNTDTQLTEDQVEAFIFDNDNTDNLGMNGYNVTNQSYSTFCNGANCWKMYVNASDYFIIEEI